VSLGVNKIDWISNYGNFSLKNQKHRCFLQDFSQKMKEKLKNELFLN